MLATRRVNARDRPDEFRGSYLANPAYPSALEPQFLWQIPWWTMVSVRTCSLARLGADVLGGAATLADHAPARFQPVQAEL